MDRTPRVNDHVVYYTTTGKPRPGIITAIVTSPTNVDIRVGHTGEVYSNVPYSTSPPRNNVWHFA